MASLRQLVSALKAISDEAAAAASRLEKDAILLGRKHLADLKKDAFNRVVADLLKLASKFEQPVASTESKGADHE